MSFISTIGPTFIAIQDEVNVTEIVGKHPRIFIDYDDIFHNCPRVPKQITLLRELPAYIRRELIYKIFNGPQFVFLRKPDLDLLKLTNQTKIMFYATPSYTCTLLSDLLSWISPIRIDTLINLPDSDDLIQLIISGQTNDNGTYQFNPQED